MMKGMRDEEEEDMMRRQLQLEIDWFEVIKQLKQYNTMSDTNKH
jgi:hypothetical protein